MATTIPNRGKMVYQKAKKTVAHQGGHWSEKKKYEAVCLWASGLSLREVSLQLEVPYDTIGKWRSSSWWNDINKDLQSEDKQKTDAKLTKILDKTLDTIMDRLEDGEFIYDQKTGKVKRTPVKLRDATVAMNTVLDKRQLIRKEPTKIVDNGNTMQQLQNLAEQFAAFVNGATPKKEKIEHVVHEVEQDDDGTYVVKEEHDSGTNL